MKMKPIWSALLMAGALLLLPAYGFADNSVTLTELTGSVQTSRPFSISRIFTRGEIANYALPQIGGAALATWQCDRMNTWPDGSLKHAIISFSYTIPAGASVTVSFVSSANPSSAGNLAATAAAAMTQAQMLNFDPGTGPATWGADIEATAGGSTQAANIRNILTAGNWRYRLQGPVVTEVVVEDRSPARAYDFGWQCMSNCTGNYTSVAWSKAPAGSIYQSLHPIFTATFYAAWPGVQLDYILEDPWSDRLQDQAYSLALKAHADLSSSRYTQTTLWHAAATRWRRRYWDGAAPGRVKIDLNFPYLVSSSAVLNWDQSLVVGSSAQNLETAAFKVAMPNPGTFYTDDPDNLLALYSTGQSQGDMETTGGRPELGPLPRWDIRWMYAQSEDLWRVMIANANSLGGIPVHVREARSDNFFYDTVIQPAPVTKAQGHFISIDARPSGWFVNISNGSGSDSITLAGTTRCSNRTAAGNSLCNDPIPPDASTPLWTPAVSHFGVTPYLAYLATGDWYFAEELYADAQFELYMQGSGAANQGRDGNTAGSVGYVNEYTFDLRGAAWPVRAIGMAGFIGPSSDAEPVYFQEKTNRSIAVREGKYNITTGAYNGNPDWTWGGSIERSWNTMGIAPGGSTVSNPFNFPYFHMNAGPIHGGTNSGQYNATAVNWEHSPWQVGYYQVALGWLQAEGYIDADLLLAAQSKYFINQVQAPGTPGYGYNPYLVALYVVPALDINNNWFQTTGSMLSVWSAGNPWTTLNSWTADAAVYNQVFPDYLDHGYNWILYAAAALAQPYNDGVLTGAGSWNWIKTANAAWAAGLGSNTVACINGGAAIDDCDNPKWGLVPRSVAPPPPPSNPCDLNKDGVVDAADVQLEVNEALKLSSATHDINGDGVVNIIDVQRVINASLGAVCVTTP